MECPYCESENFNYLIAAPIIRPWGDGEGYDEFTRYMCSDCGREFLIKDSYELVEEGCCITREEFEMEYE